MVRIRYQDEDFNEHEETYSGILARIIQHEYDHLQGTLFVEKVAPIKKVLLKNKLKDISLGKVKVDYKMILPPQKKKKKI